MFGDPQSAQIHVMPDLRLILPEYDTPERALDPAPRHLPAWIAASRTGDHDESGSRVLEVLLQYNRHALDTGGRYQAMMQLAPVVHEIVRLLQERMTGTTYPLAEKQRNRAQLIAQLLQETALGFKRVVHELVNENKKDRDDEIELQSVYHAMVFLADALLAAYLVYVPEPENAWGELHRLYRYAERRGLHTTSAGVGAPAQENAELKTINHAYRRVVLLFLANPYHLMGGEAAIVFNYLDQWALYGRLLPVDRVMSLEGKYFVDLNGDVPPQYAHHATVRDGSSEESAGAVFPPNTAADSDLRVLDVSRLVETISAMVKKFTELQSDPSTAAIPFKERIYRDMLSRLDRAWGGRRERKDERLPNSAQIIMVAGLSPSHHFVSGESEFTPEQDEVHFHRPAGVAAKPTFSLMPLEHEPWKTAEKLDKLEAGVAKPRISKFIGAEDLWEKIYATKAGANARKGDMEAEFTAQLWSQVNGSHGGLGISCDGRGKRIRVGDIAVLKHGQMMNEPWRAGIVRWLRDMQDGHLDIGVMTIDGSLRAVAVRSVGGVGSGGEYFRSLIVTHDGRETLLVPSAIYDLGTRLVLNNDKSLHYVKLTRICETTASFSQFEFQDIDTPASEQKNIEAIKSA